MTQLIISDLSKSYSGKPVFEGVSLSLTSGIYMLTGPSGCGKTTFTRILCGLESADSGTVKLIPEMAGVRISYMFQEPRLFPWLNIVGNVESVTGCRRDTALQLLGELGLGGDTHKYPAELSGGMQRRAAFARTLAKSSDLYIFDEPMSGLDDALQQKVCEMIKKYISSDAITIIITHERDKVQQISNSHLIWGTWERGGTRGRAF